MAHAAARAVLGWPLVVTHLTPPRFACYPRAVSFVVRSTAEKLGPGNYGGIARRAGISKQHVSRVLRGERNCSLPVGARIAAAARVSLDQLYKFTVKLETHVRGRPTRKSLIAALKIPRRNKVKLPKSATRYSRSLPAVVASLAPTKVVPPRTPRTEHPAYFKAQMARLGVKDPVESAADRIRRELRERAQAASGSGQTRRDTYPGT